QLPEFFLAKQLIVHQSSFEEYVALAFFLLANKETAELTVEPLCENLLPQTTGLFEASVQKLTQQTKLNITIYPEIDHYLKKFFFKWFFRKKYHLYEFEVAISKQTVVDRLISSLAFATYIYMTFPYLKE